MTLFQAFGQFAAAGVPAITSGMVLVTPSSVSAGAGTISIGANGQVSLTNVTDFSINGVFTSAYDDYCIIANTTANAGTGYDMRLRAAATDDSTSNYAKQDLLATGGSLTASRSTSQTSIADILQTSASGWAGVIIYVYGPALSQATVIRSMASVEGTTAYFLRDIVGFHNVASAFDGFSMIETNQTTGSLAVYGMRS